MQDGPSTYAIVLAGGEGTRLRSLTTDRAGRSVPKQFCSLRGGRSLFGDALERARRVTSNGRVLAVLAQDQREHWAGEVRGLLPDNVVVQPRNRGTAAGILLPLLAIHERDPHARLLVLPSDHHVRDEDVLAISMLEALDAADDRRVSLLGIEPDAAETEYGWIVPGPARSGWNRPRGVVEFVEKPDTLGAHELLARGGVWNSFLLAGRAESFLDLYARTLPDLLAAFTSTLLAHRSHRAAWIEMLYSSIEAHDFSRAVLEPSTETLGVVLVPPCGWTDLGTPERVVRCLEEEPGCPSQQDAEHLVLARGLARH